MFSKVAKRLKKCSFDVVSARLAPAKGGWAPSLVIVGAKQGIAAKPKGTARLRLKGRKLRGRNKLARRLLHGCA